MEITGFLKNYGDKHHHMKEEKILFPIMIENIGGFVEGIIDGVMLVEHDEGRNYVKGMKKAIEAYKENPLQENRDALAYQANGYIQILSEHTDKEEQVLYQIAQVHLDEKAKEKVDALCREVENRDEQDGVQSTYLSLLKKLEKKYSI